MQAKFELLSFLLYKMQKPSMTWDAVVAARLAAQDQLHQADIAWSAGRFGPDADRLAADYAAIKARYEKLTKLSLGLQPATGLQPAKD
jgi:hypothetical protein